MNEIERQIEEIDKYLSEERLKQMTQRERIEYLDLIQQIRARIQALIEIEKGGND